MSKKQSVIILLLLTATVLFSVSKIKAQEDEIGTLIKDVSADSQKGAIFGYTYQMKFSYHRKGGLGKKFSRLYEAIIPNRFSLKKTYQHPFILIEDSEKQITNETVRFMRNKLIEEIERAEKEAETNINEKIPDRKDGGYWTIGFRAGDKGIRIDVMKLISNATFSNMERLETGGRKVVTLEFSPKPDATFDADISYLSRIEGKIWIDEADRRIMKIEGFPVGWLAELSDKSDAERQQKIVFLFSQMRVSEGFWFPKDVFVDFTKNAYMFDAVRIEYSFDKYRKSTTEVRSSTMETPKDAETEEKVEKQEKPEKIEKQKKDQ